MKTIGLLGGTGWSSTITYYQLLNTKINSKYGGFHSADLILKSIDYHEIMTAYSSNPDKIQHLLKAEIDKILSFDISCLVVCCNSLHKYLDKIISAQSLNRNIPICHAVQLTGDYVIRNKFNSVLLLATKFTLEDGFFANALTKRDINVIVPNKDEISKMNEIHQQLMNNVVRPESTQYFHNLIIKYQTEAVIIGCSEYALLFEQYEGVCKLINPIELQVEQAIKYSTN